MEECRKRSRRSKADVVNSYSSTLVGSHPEGVSPAGAHDMSGNVIVWVHDWLMIDCDKPNAQPDPQGPEEKRVKVEKDGLWGIWPYPLSGRARRILHRHAGWEQSIRRAEWRGRNV